LRPFSVVVHLATSHLATGGAEEESAVQRFSDAELTIASYDSHRIALGPYQGDVVSVDDVDRRAMANGNPRPSSTIT